MPPRANFSTIASRRTDARRLPVASGASAGGDVSAHFLGFALDLADSRLDDIADGDNAGEPPVRHDWHMTEASARHLRHHLVDRVAFATGDDLAGHDGR